jgi:uncharacterized protein (DUF1786 family)
MLSNPDSPFASTSSPVNPQSHKLVVVPYGNCEIVVCLTQDNRFVGISELRINKDFLTPEQRVASSGCLDVEEFYRD